MPATPSISEPSDYMPGAQKSAAASSIKWQLIACLFFTLLINNSLLAQQNDTDSIESQIDALNLPALQTPLCFGLRDITDPRALAVCDALQLEQNVKARELSEAWLKAQPESPAAQFALAEVLLTIEGNMPRALYHLNQAEQLTNYQSLEEAFESNNFEWHYLTLSQLSYVHQLMGDQIKSLEYLDKLNRIYGQDVESFRGWPLIKLKQYQAARESANLVLQYSEDGRDRARAWNTLCAADLASLTPVESMSACDKAIDEDESLAGEALEHDTVYLANAAEVALSLLQMDKAEDYLNRASRYLNAESVANPWIYIMNLTMSQGRFDEARAALDNMLIWRENQAPIVGVMNRAEHYLVSASFLLLAGYAEDAVKLTATALNQPDRNGSYSADDSQKDSVAALLNMMANKAQHEILLEQIATLDFTEALAARFEAMKISVVAWRSGRRAASLFADTDVLQSRLRPYAPLDVYISEWVEPELIALMGTGVMSTLLEQAREKGAFMLNEGYYFAYKAEISCLEKDREACLLIAEKALSLLPPQEVLLQARLRARMAEAALNLDRYDIALSQFQLALQLDPSIIRRLSLSLPVRINTDGSEFASQTSRYLLDSPRFHKDDNGLLLELGSAGQLSICLQNRNRQILSCQQLASDTSQSSKWNAQQLSQLFHAQTFGLGYDISKAQRSIILGASVIHDEGSSAQFQTLVK